MMAAQNMRNQDLMGMNDDDYYDEEEIDEEEYQ